MLPVHAKHILDLRNEPSPEQIATQVHLDCKAQNYAQVCFAGVGDPLLRLSNLEQAAKLIKQDQPAIPLRVNTNGLVTSGDCDNVARRLISCGIEAVSIAMATANSKQYNLLMCPERLRISPVYSLDLTHDDVVSFVRACVSTGLNVECTAVENPKVDLNAVRELAHELGAGFRSRSWHPN